jgi:hypothetical protein
MYWVVRSINNFIVELIRMIPGMGDFGNIMDENMFNAEEDTDDPATEENTEAVKENTQAVRDLQREFRNLPSGYKVNNTIYAAQDPAREVRPRPTLESGTRRRAGPFYNQRPRL